MHTQDGQTDAGHHPTRSKKATKVTDSVQTSTLLGLYSSLWWPVLMFNQISDLHLSCLSGIGHSLRT